MTLKSGSVYNGFHVLEAKELPEQRGQGLLIEHEKSGARIFHVFADDDENLFAVGFPTPPIDDTGLSHILEHSVLAGSKKFPLKDPFMEMTKMSMATFLNAMTYSDRTAYPVASNVVRDFYNLADVYFDAVFHPLLLKLTFMQEGHRLAFHRAGDATTNLIVKGIVFNEMKGSYANPANRAWDLGARALFPDTPYGKDSGGDPARIPELTWESLTSYHSRYYHPSNAYFFLYGSIETKTHLDFLASRLDAFERREQPPLPGCQPRWNAPRRLADNYPIGLEDSVLAKSFHSIDWLVCKATQMRESLAFELIDQLLLGNEAAPLLRAIIDSKLGQDLSYSGYSGGSLEGTFRVSLMGSEPDLADEFMNTVMAALKDVTEREICLERVQAAFQQLTYQIREIRETYPVRIMDQVFSQWLLGDDPFRALHAGEVLDQLKMDFESDNALFNSLIRTRLIENPHRVLSSLLPERALQQKKDAEFENKMKAMKEAMTSVELDEVIILESELSERQSLPDTPETIATLPCLKIDEIPRKPVNIPVDYESEDGLEIIRTGLFSNGVNYLTLAFDMSALPERLYRYLSLYSYCVQKMGAGADDYLKTAERVSACTGGIDMWSHLGFHLTDLNRSVRKIRFGMKCLDGQEIDALRIFRALIFEINVRDRKRLRDVVTQAYAAMRENVLTNALTFAHRHAARGYSTDARLRYLKEGLPQFRFLEALSSDFDRWSDELISGLEGIRSYILTRSGFSACLTGSDTFFDRARDSMGHWRNEMIGIFDSDGSAQTTAVMEIPIEGSTNWTGLAAPIDISYCVRTFPVTAETFETRAEIAVGSRLVSVDYMIDQIRIKGGAYGAGCTYAGMEHSYRMHSYRDPWISRTLDVFSGALDFVSSANWSQSEIERSIIGTAKHSSRPLRPENATGLALCRHYFGETDDYRARQHDTVLSVKAVDVKETLIRTLEDGLSSASTCVITSRERLETANSESSGGKIEIVDVLK